MVHEAGEIPLRVKLPSFLEDLSNNGDGRIEGFKSDDNRCLMSCRSNNKGQMMDDLRALRA
jgi:hypothetical protein